MKKRSIVIFLILISIILIGLNFRARNSSNSLEITEVDEKVILEYLDKNTDDILPATVGKLYSAFTILGTDKDKIYIWLLKEEYKKDDTSTAQSGVSLPVVLYIKDNSNKIEITNHKIPKDGAEYEKDIKKLFPRNIINIINNNNNEGVKELEERIKNRVEKNFNL